MNILSRSRSLVSKLSDFLGRFLSVCVSDQSVSSSESGVAAIRVRRKDAEGALFDDGAAVTDDAD